MRRLSAIFLQGLITLLPLAVTVVVIVWLGTAAERTLGPAIRWVLPAGWYIPGIGVLAGLALAFFLGVLVNVWGVPQLIRLGEKLIARIPLVKTIYGTVRDLLGFFAKPDGLGGMSKVVLVSIGDTDIRLVGLLTRERFDDLPAGFGHEGHVAVFVPLSYQMGGFTLILPRSRVQPVDMRIEDAMRFVVTAGAMAEKSESRAVIPPVAK